MRVVRWILGLARTPRLALFTLYYFLRLGKCGVPVGFSTTMILRNPGNIAIGENCTFSNFVILDAHDRISIGDDCMFANNTTIATATHDYSVDPMNSRNITKPVSVGNNVWFGIGATVLPGVTIGDGAVIGARSLVTRDVPPRAIVTGTPAKVVKYRPDPIGEVGRQENVEQTHGW
jgi:acetyltransferase-like isoleucine patch superfamily enzyme